MDMVTMIKELIKPELLVLVPVLYLSGFGLRQMSVDNRWIPLILGISGILLSLLYIFGTSSVRGTQQIAITVFVGVTQGVLSAGGSVYVDQLVKKLKEEENENEQ